MISSSALIPTISGPAPRSSALAHGAVLRASVSRGTPPGDTAGSVTLRIGSRTLTARTLLPLKAGDELVLELQRVSSQATFRVRSINGLETRASADPLAVLARNHLPAQTDVPALLRSLLVPGSATAGPAARLLHHFPTLAQIRNSSALRRAFRESGLFLESRLADPSASIGAVARSDLKALLLHERGRLAGEAGESVPSALREAVEGLVTRITLDQIKTTRAREDGLDYWTCSIPIKDGDRVDVLRLQVEKRRRANAREPGRWAVRVDTDLPKLGPLQISLNLDGTALSVIMWARRDGTVTLMNRMMPQLKGQLQALGMNISHLACVAGNAPPGHADRSHSPNLRASA